MAAQEESDKPASVLLERIKKAQETGGAKPSARQQTLYEQNESVSLAAEG